jgi:hypothetical protein
VLTIGWNTQYREVRMLEVKEVLRLWLRGVPKKRIALERGLDPKTVRRQIELAQECGLDRVLGEGALTDELLVVLAEKLRPAVSYSKGEGWRLCEEHREFIRGHLERRVRLSKIRKLLRRQGVLVSYPSLWRFAVGELGFGRGGGTVPIADCEPGEEVQLDTGWVGWSLILVLALILVLLDRSVPETEAHRVAPTRQSFNLRSGSPHRGTPKDSEGGHKMDTRGA